MQCASEIVGCPMDSKNSAGGVYGWVQEAVAGTDGWPSYGGGAGRGRVALCWQCCADGAMTVMQIEPDGMPANKMKLN